jgi:hypothetical protein
MASGILVRPPHQLRDCTDGSEQAMPQGWQQGPGGSYVGPNGQSQYGGGQQYQGGGAQQGNYWG